MFILQGPPLHVQVILSTKGGGGHPYHNLSYGQFDVVFTDRLLVNTSFIFKYMLIQMWQQYLIGIFYLIIANSKLFKCNIVGLSIY